MDQNGHHGIHRLHCDDINLCNLGRGLLSNIIWTGNRSGNSSLLVLVSVVILVADQTLGRVAR